MTCHAQRMSNGDWTCDNCKATWDSGDTPPCINAQYVEEKRAALGPAYNPPMTLAQYAEYAGYDLSAWQKIMLNSLEKTRGNAQRR